MMPPQAGPINEVPTTDGRPAHILIVDDESANVRLLRMVLGARGYRTTGVSSGDEALAWLRDNLPDLILLDIMMPRISGQEVLERVRAEERTQFLPIVMVSALGETEHRVRALEAGADDFLTKPINDTELLARVRSLLRIKRLHDALEERNRLLNDALMRSVSEPVALQIMQDPARYLHPGGERRTVTVLFGDLRGYTSIAEQLSPGDAMALLNAYLGCVIEAIHRYGGTVNQLLGDGVMALFGAPVDHDDDPWRAVQAALEMRDSTGCLIPAGLPDIRLNMGIGITTGEVVAGHIGSERRIDYTAVGDPVNLAAHLTAMAGPGQIVVTAATYQYIQPFVEVQDLGTQRGKGRQQWVQTYSILRLRA